MARTLVKTSASGWFIDAKDPEGGKVRKTKNDDIFDTLEEAQAATAVLEKAHGKDKASEPDKTVAETGKVLVGKTLTIRCAWKEKGKRCTNERTIKPQDKFQVKYCVDHQKEHRKAVRREKQKARSAARRAAQGEDQGRGLRSMGTMTPGGLRHSPGAVSR